MMQQSNLIQSRQNNMNNPLSSLNPNFMPGTKEKETPNYVAQELQKQDLKNMTKPFGPR